jgi:hypothetical protein
MSQASAPPGYLEKKAKNKIYQEILEVIVSFHTTRTA